MVAPLGERELLEELIAETARRIAENVPDPSTNPGMEAEVQRQLAAPDNTLPRDRIVDTMRLALACNWWKELGEDTVRRVLRERGGGEAPPSPELYEQFLRAITLVLQRP
jgi:hypothetical protein